MSELCYPVFRRYYVEGRLVSMEYYDAVNYNGFTKAFQMDEMEESMESKIKNYVRCLTGFIEDKQERIELVHHKEIHKSHLGFFMTRAPYYCLIYINELEKELLDAGYLLGQLSLYLTSKEIGSCIVGIEQAKKPIAKNAIYRSIAMQSVEKFDEPTWVVVMGFGTAEHKIKQKKKRLNELIVEKKCLYKTDIDERIRSIISVGTHAPSQMLFHPYRYIIHEKHVYLYAKSESMMTQSQRICVFLDAGIMLAFYGIRAEELWMTMFVKRSEKKKSQPMKNHKYIVSISFEDQ